MGEIIKFENTANTPPVPPGKRNKNRIYRVDGKVTRDDKDVYVPMAEKIHRQMSQLPDRFRSNSATEKCKPPQKGLLIIINLLFRPFYI